MAGSHAVRVLENVSRAADDEGRQIAFECELLLSPSRLARRNGRTGGGNSEGSITLSVENRAEKVATFRFIRVFLMQPLARRDTMTPRMEAKVRPSRADWTTD